MKAGGELASVLGYPVTIHHKEIPMTLRVLVLTIFALMAFAPGALALDPECDPSDPAFHPFDVTSGDYVSPGRTVHFCSSITPQNMTGWMSDLTCVVSVSATPYAQAPAQPGQVVLVEILAADAGPMEIVCTVEARDNEGGPTVLTSPAVQAQYNPEPVMEAPALLAGPPRSLP